MDTFVDTFLTFIVRNPPTQLSMVEKENLIFLFTSDLTDPFFHGDVCERRNATFRASCPPVAPNTKL